jgi:hypothetical protein
LIHLNHEDLARIAGRKLVNKVLEVFTVKVVILVKKVLSCQRLNQAIEPEG